MASLTAIDTSQGRSLVGLADRAELLPRDRPCRLDGLLSERVVPLITSTDPAHVVVVLGDDAAEGDLVTGSRGRKHVAARLAAMRVSASIPTLRPGVGLLSQAMASS